MLLQRILKGSVTHIANPRIKINIPRANPPKGISRRQENREDSENLIGSVSNITTEAKNKNKENAI
jgi:hypothetical protein